MKTWAYLLPSSVLLWPSKVSVDYYLFKALRLNTLSVLYLRDSGRMALRTNLCVVFLRALDTAMRLIPHLSLKLLGVTSGCLLLLIKVLVIGTFVTPQSILGRTKLTTGSGDAYMT